MSDKPKFIVRSGHPLSGVEIAQKYDVSPLEFERVRGEFFEMPGLRVTSEQAARLWGLTLEGARELLDAMVDEGVLAKTKNNNYIKASLPKQDSRRRTRAS